MEWYPVSPSIAPRTGKDDAFPMNFPGLKPRLTAVLCLGALFCAPVAQAGFPQPDTAFLASAAGDIDAFVEMHVGAVTSAADAVDALSILLVNRRAAFGNLLSDGDPTSLDMIETRDLYDAHLVSAMSELVLVGSAIDTTYPSEDEILRFAFVMGEPLDTGTSPLAFMVVGMAEVAISTVDSLRRDETYPDDQAAKLALRLINEPLTRHMSSYDNMTSRQNAERFRHAAVVSRMRCSHGNPWVPVGQKNKVHSNGDISTIYYLNCPQGDATTVQYYLEAASRLNRLAVRQDMKTTPEKTRPGAGLDP